MDGMRGGLGLDHPWWGVTENWRVWQWRRAHDCGSTIPPDLSKLTWWIFGWVSDWRLGWQLELRYLIISYTYTFKLHFESELSWWFLGSARLMPTLPKWDWCDEEALTAPKQSTSIRLSIGEGSWTRARACSEHHDPFPELPEVPPMSRPPQPHIGINLWIYRNSTPLDSGAIVIMSFSPY